MILITPENYPYTQATLELDGAVFSMVVELSTYANSFLFSLSTEEGVELCTGVKMCQGADLLATCNIFGRPAGQLLVSALSSGVYREPAMGDWGVTHVIAYVTAEDLA